MSEESVFAAARAIADPVARTAYLDRACAGDPALRREVEALLAAHDASNPLDRPPADLARTGAYVPTDSVEQPGAVIAGRFKLLERIGEGGMGEVWVADQLEPVKRRVALKVIKAGMDSKGVLARFEAERQALALMDHPHIAKVLDAGTTPEGRPYFAMELVKGTPITEFCDARRLSPRERLELFVPVCQAIQHAHTKGIIHRDVKPSNVLVALHDEKPVPKVIDFGVAKAVGQSLTDKTLYTALGTLVGTPAYMAPEQATFNQLDVDTRADVYALGVLLYELLAGSPPFEPARLRKAALDEVLRLVREEDPLRPSQRLSTSEARASIAAVRQTDPARLSKLMRGELDWIVMKALEKDRNRRYETATGLAADVQRYLAGEAVLAHPPGAAYRLRKFARKNRAALVTATAFAGFLIVAAGLSSWLAVKASRAQAVADEKRIEAETNAKEAKKNADLYRKESNDNFAGRLEAEITAKSLQVDLDLAELRTDPRVGLLRLARPRRQGMTDPQNPKHKYTIREEWEDVNGNPVPVPLDHVPEMDDDRGSYRGLREFVTMAVLAAGQEFAPLAPPISHDGHRVTSWWVSPDHQTLLTLGADASARLWDLRTARPIATLRQRSERLVNCGFSLDGRTVFTDDETGVARFWEPGGAYRAQIERRPDIYPAALDGGTRGNGVARSECTLIGRDRLLTRRVVARPRPGRPEVVDQEFAGPVELWATATGRLVARLDRPGCSAGSFRFVGDGRWVAATDGASTVLVFAAGDGRLAGRLTHPAGEIVNEIDASPSGRWIATVAGPIATAGQTGTASGPGRAILHKPAVRVWDAASWTAGPRAWLAPTPRQESISPSIHFRTDDLIVVEWRDLLADYQASAVYHVGRDEPVATSESVVCDVLLPGGELALAEAGRLYDTRTGQRVRPPVGRRFHPDVARFAADERYVVMSSPDGAGLIDARVDKVIPTRVGWGYTVPPGNLPGLGMVTLVDGDWTEIRLLPEADWLDIPPKLLELWVQVAVRGELGPDGEFVKWDEPTWEKKRQELAAMPTPEFGFPFPGHVATDKLHWLRQEYESASYADKPGLARRLRDRAEGAGDRAEVVRWRAELAKYPEAGPPPREVKP